MYEAIKWPQNNNFLLAVLVPKLLSNNTNTTVRRHKKN